MSVCIFLRNLVSLFLLIRLNDFSSVRFSLLFKIVSILDFVLLAICLFDRVLKYAFNKLNLPVE